MTLADERGADDVTGTVLKAIADVMLDRPDEALKTLANPQIGNQLDAPLWRAVALARQGKWADAHDRFKDVDAALGALPIELQRMALRHALRAAIEVHDFGGADKVLNELQTIGVPDEEAPAIAVLAGRLSQGMGRNEDALTNYRAAVASSDRRAAAAGRLRETMLRFALGDMPRKEVINELEMLTTVWRGDETEAEGLKELAHLYTEDGRYREAFHVMRAAMMAHPDSDLTRKIQDEAAVSFETLFLGGKSDALPPIEALGLFYDYRELTPIGRRGDEMIRKLADRLIAVDLLDQAAELLQHQVDHRLHGAARAQVATHLALIYLMNRKPDRALATLRTTRMDGLSNELREQRLLLEARALSETGRHDLALEIIADIEGRQAQRLRADILWSARRWRQAAEQIELYYGDRWREFTPLSESERVDVLRAAIGYALGDEPIGLGRLREKYAAKMADTPDRHAFDVVSAPTGTAGSEFKTVARTVTGIDTLDAFLREMRARYPDTAPVPADGEADKAAPAAAKPPAKPEAAKLPAGAANKPVPEKAAAANAKPDPAASPLPPKAPAGTPTKPDPSPTGSISRSGERGTALAVARMPADAGVSHRRPWPEKHVWRVPAARESMRLGLRPVALDQRSRHQAPAVHQHEKDQLERQRDHHRRQHHHAHGHQDARHHQVDDQKRQEQQEADLEGALELGDHEGRHQHAQRQILGFGGRGFMRHVDEQLQILLAHVLLHEGAQGDGAALEGLLGGDLVGDQRADAGVVGLLQGRAHHEGGQKQRERDDHRIGRGGGGAERGAQQREHHHDAGERRHHDEDRGRQRQHRQQRDHLDHALGEPAALSEIDADVLRARRRHRQRHQPCYSGRHRH